MVRVATLCCVLAVACVGPKRTAVEPSRSGSRPLSLSVVGTPRPGDDPRLELSVRAEGDALPARFVVQKRWAGEEEVLAHLALTGAECDGRPVALGVEELDVHMAWTFPAPCRAATVRYVLRPPKRGLEWGYEFDVVATGTFFSAIAETALLLPDVSDDTRANVEVSWELSALQPGAEGVYSLGPGAHDVTMRALRHAYLAAGVFARSTARVANLHLEARAPLGTAGFEAATRDVERFLGAQAKLFGDDRDETLRVLWVGMPSGGGSHGTSLSASAIVWRDAKAPWDLDDARLLAHEMFHLYNGQIIERSAGAGTDAETWWFSEGFTEHYTDELLRRGGVTTAAQWLEAVRDRLRRYHRHPSCEVPNASADMRWGGADVQLPYLRGSIVAAFVDGRIRARSKGARSLDDVMRALLARARRGAPPIEPHEVLEGLAAELTPEDAARVRSVVLDGKRLSLPRDTFGPCLVVVGEGAGQDLAVAPGQDLEACVRRCGALDDARRCAL